MFKNREDILDQIKFNLHDKLLRVALEEIILLINGLEEENFNLKEKIKEERNCIIQVVQALSPITKEESPNDFYKRTKEMAKQFLEQSKNFCKF